MKCSRIEQLRHLTGILAFLHCRSALTCDRNVGISKIARGATINQSSTIKQRNARPVQPRAIGAAALSVLLDEEGKTRIADLRQSGSMKLVFPMTWRRDAEAILVNTAGGITGGDRFDLKITVQPGAALSVTTQAAERAYRAQPGETGLVTTRLTVRSGGQLNWLPQELILFDRSALRRRLNIELAPDARLLMVEPLVFGRTAMNERVRSIHFRDGIQITRQGSPIYADGILLNGDAAAHLARAAIAEGAGAMASIVFVHPDAAARLSRVRSALPRSAGASMIAPDVMVIRLLAADGFEMRRDLMPILEQLSHHPLPASWRL